MSYLVYGHTALCTRQQLPFGCNIGTERGCPITLGGVEGKGPMKRQLPFRERTTLLV